MSHHRFTDDLTLTENFKYCLYLLSLMMMILCSLETSIICTCVFDGDLHSPVTLSTICTCVKCGKIFKMNEFVEG